MILVMKLEVNHKFSSNIS